MCFRLRPTACVAWSGISGGLRWRWGMESRALLMELDMPAFKIASGDLKNIPLIQHVARFGRPLFVSTGGGAMEDVQRAYDAIVPINSQLCIMQCTASYPCDFEQLNLRVIETYREAFPDIVIGLSSHDNGIAMALVGYMLGARVIEKSLMTSLLTTKAPAT